MAGELIIFPVRFGFRVARFAVRTGVHATEQAITLATHVIRSVTPDGSAEARERPASNGVAPTAPADVEVEPAEVEPAEVEFAEVEPSEVEPAIEPQRADVDADSVETPTPAHATASDAPPLRAEPEHVSEEPTVVDEFAEPGAEEGAGAEVNVAEPWEGYAQLSAAEVISRLADAAPAELAAVQLYEIAHRQRPTVTSAAARELRAKSGRGAATADQSRKEQPSNG